MKTDFVEEFSEHISELLIIGFFFEAQSFDCLQIPGELIGESFAEDLDWSIDLHVFDPLVFISLRLELLVILPGQNALKAVHRDIADALHIVPAGLLDPFVGVYRGVSCCPSQAFPLFVRDVLPIWHHVLLGQSEVENEQLLLLPVDPHAEVVRLYIPMDKIPRVQVLYPQDHLVHQHQHGLQPELPRVLPQQALQRGAHQIHHQIVVLIFSPAAVDSGDAVVGGVDISVEHVIELALGDELWVLGFH